MKARVLPAEVACDSCDGDGCVDCNDEGWRPAVYACRRCSDCTGEAHHWMDGAIREDDDFTAFACKHCDMTAAMCDACDQPAPLNRHCSEACEAEDARSLQ